MMSPLITVLALQAAVPPCTPSALGADIDRTAIEAPDGQTQLLIGSINQNSAVTLDPLADPINPNAGSQTWTPPENTTGEPQILVWRGTDGSLCFQTLPADDANDSADGNLDDMGGASIDDLVAPQYAGDECALAASDWMKVRSVDGRGEAVVVLEPGRGVCYSTEEYGVVGDPIHVGVFTDKIADWQRSRITFEPCALEPTAPNIYESGRLTGSLGSPTAGASHQLFMHLPRTCFNTALAIEVQPLGDGDENPERLNFRQFDRYRAGLQMGVLFTELHFREFGLRSRPTVGQDGTTTGTENIIFLERFDGEGPRYFASLTIYGFLHYFGELLGRDRYLGRDVVHDQSFVDRVGLVLGVGLSDPGNEFVFGSSLEIVRGLSVAGLWYFSQVDELSGVALGDVFLGAKADIPVTRTWTSDLELGLSIDLRYVTSLFQTGGGG